MAIIHNWKESTIFQTCADLKGWQTCRRAWEMLHYTLEVDQTRAFPLNHSTNYPFVIEDRIAPEIWQTLPIQTHQIIRPAHQDLEKLQEACDHLSTHHDDWQQSRELLQAVAFVQLKENPPRGETCLTSVSIPDLPFCSFFSLKALFHIPPQILSPEPHISFLAENLYHESIHHQVTLNLLENDLLQENYHAQLSPQIPIPWREQEVARMKFWELDRILHAFSVYVALLPYRLNEAKRQASSLWWPALDQALACARFLGKTLWQNRSVFTPLGQDYILSRWSMLQSYLPASQAGIYPC